MSSAQFLNTPAKYSDIVLPVTTYWERPGGLASSNREFLLCYSQVTEPLYEAKNDQVSQPIMEKMGIDPKQHYAISEKQQFFNRIAGSKVVVPGTQGKEFQEAGSTITDADIKNWGVEGKASGGRESACRSSSTTAVTRWSASPATSSATPSAMLTLSLTRRLTPARRPAESSSTCSQSKADLFNSFGFIIGTTSPIPEYITPNTGYETTFKDGKIGGEKGEYPYLLYNIHYLRRCHSTFDNCPWLREAWPNPVYINASDAAELGIKTGDTVLISTKTAQALRKASVMQSMMPGVVSIPHGAWVNVDEETALTAAVQITTCWATR